MLVQFMHPGGQPKVIDPGRKEWNAGDHCRSFMALQGSSTTDIEGTNVTSSRLGVWGEWEAPARVVPTGSSIAPNAFEPETPVFPSRPGLQNTDPFIYDGPFLYSNCKQVRRDGRATRLRQLDRGDVIIFGSQIDGAFALDTVFVIAHSVLFQPATGERQLSSRVPLSFLHATMRPLAGVRRPPSDDGKATLKPCDPEEWNEEDESEACGPPCMESRASSFRLYCGATPATAVEGMFSFAPAKRLTRSIVPFQRPVLDLSFISAGLNQNWRLCLADVCEGWRAIATKVLGLGLELGVEFEIGKNDFEH